MRKSLKWISLLCAISCVGGSLAACDSGTGTGNSGNGGNGGDSNGVTTLRSENYATEMLSTMDDVSNGYNSDLFYVNTLEFQVADPTVIQITEGEEKGYFYAYGTSDEIGCHGFQAWRSKDLSHWECTGIAYQPDFAVTWATYNYWAPEIIYDSEQKLYYLFYNAYNQNDNNRLCLSVAVSEHPAGPFRSPDGIRDGNGNMLSASRPVFDFTSNNSALSGFGDDFIKDQALDASPFIDPSTGKKYMYFSYYDNYGIGSFVYGVEMLDWYTPDYSTLTMLTRPGYTKIEGGEKVTEGSVNEGPFMVYHEGKYYLTLSVFGYTDPNYRVIQAISDSPLGVFEKVDEYDGGKVISTDTVNWSHLVSAGHHCFIQCGDEVFIAYHTFKDRNSIAGGRALAVDKVVWTKNSEGVDVMHTNGPTWSVQALPESVSGYKNIAPSAKVTANNTAEGSDAALLTDELIKYQEFDLAEEYVANEGKSTIKLSWDDYKTVRGIMVYNSYNYDYTYVAIDKVEFEYLQADGSTGVAAIEGLEYDWDWHFEGDYQFIRPGGAAIAEFDEMPVRSVTITVSSVGGCELALGEIVVLGKDTACAGVESFGVYSYENEECGSPHVVVNGAKIGDVEEAGISTTWGYDASHDDGTENAYLLQEGCTDQYAYFKDIYSTDFYIEAEITVIADKAFANDGYPKFGIAMTCGGSYPNTIFYYVDAVNYTNSVVGCAQRTMDNSNWDWDATEQLVNVSGLRYKTENYGEANCEEYYVKLSVARKGAQFYMMCNDQLVIYYDSFNIFTDTQESAVGFLSFNTPMKIKNYSATTEETVVDEWVDKCRAGMEGDTFGEAGSYKTNTGWDLSGDHGATPVLSQTLTGDQYAYFKGVNATKYYVETELSATTDLGDSYPKFGIAVRNATNMFFFYVDASAGFTAQRVGYVSRNEANTDWVWGSSVEQAVNISYKNGATVKLGLLRDGDTFKLYVNGELVFTVENLRGLGESDNAVVGLLTFTMGAQASDYFVTTDLTDSRIPA